MALLFKLLISAIGVISGTVILTHSYPLTQLFGHADLAERYLGTAGTYTMWKLLGVILIVVAVIYLFK